MNSRQRILAAGLFVVAWGTNVSTPLILRYQDRLNLSDLGAVGIFTIYVGGILFSLLFAGRLSDRFGRRPLVLPFTAASGIASIILIYGRNSLLPLFVGRLLLGAVSGAVLSVGTAWLTELSSTPLDERGRVSLATLTTLVIYIGFGVGPISSAVYDKFGPSPLVVPFLVHAAATAAVLVAMWWLPETKAPEPGLSLRPQLGVPAHARSDFLTTVAPAAVWVFGFPSTAFALFPVILRDAVGGDNDVLVAGVTGSITALSVMLSRPLIQRAGSPRTALRLALWVGVGGYVLGTFAFVTDIWQIIPLAAVALGTASGTLLTAGLAITEAIADDSNRGALNATFYLGTYTGMTMPVVITLLARFWSINGGLILVTCVAAGVALMLQVRSIELEPA